MKIYTRAGDNGTTSLWGQRRVRKSDPRVECCGAVDELNAALGLAAAGASSAMRAQLQAVQNELFVIGAHLANTGGLPEVPVPDLDTSAVLRLEEQIDSAEAQLPRIDQFILPGGSETAARLHLARAICRRVERVVVGFALQNPVSPNVLPYLNRLSDWLFVMARLADQQAGVAEILWRKDRQSQ